nr:syntaxin-81 isoform X1 [Tanacetum cinerariifolium]
EDFKDAVNRGALSLGFNEAKRAALMASFIIHKPRESIFVKACKEQIDILKTSITNEEWNSKGWLGGIRGDNANADTIAHKHGVFDQLRAVRFQEAINRAMPRRKPKRAPEKTYTDMSYSSNSLESREPTSSETRDHGEIPAEPMKVQQQLLDDETRALQIELSSLLDAAR